MRSMRKKAPTPEDLEAKGIPGSGLNRAQLVQQAVQDRAIDYIKGGNIEGLIGMAEEGSSELPMLARHHTKSGMHPLAVAADEGRIEAIEVLIAAKLPVDQKDRNEMTAFLYSAKNGYTKISEMLMAAEADIRLEHAPSMENALFLASRYNHIPTVRLLAQKGMEAEIVNKKGETPLWNALKCQYFDLAKLLLQNFANINYQHPYNGDTPLHCSAFDGKIDTLTFILDREGDLNIRNKNGETPFIIAAKHGHILFLEELLKRNAKINEADDLDRTPLLTACMVLRADVVKFLLEHGADPNISDKWGYSPLAFSCRAANPNIEIIEALITGGAHIDSMDKNFNTPLMHACSKGQLVVAKLLLMSGANPDLDNLDGKKAADLIADEDMREVFMQDAISCSLDSSIVRPQVTGAVDKPAWIAEILREKQIVEMTENLNK